MKVPADQPLHRGKRELDGMPPLSQAEALRAEAGSLSPGLCHKRWWAEVPSEEKLPFFGGATCSLPSECAAGPCTVPLS